MKQEYPGLAGPRQRESMSGKMAELLYNTKKRHDHICCAGFILNLSDLPASFLFCFPNSVTSLFPRVYNSFPHPLNFLQSPPNAFRSLHL